MAEQHDADERTPINPIDPANVDDAVDTSEPILRSDAITDLDDVPHPADYDEEMASANLVESGLGTDVPGTDLHEVTQQGEQAIAKVSGNILPDPTGGDGDFAALMGEEAEDPDHESLLNDEEE